MKTNRNILKTNVSITIFGTSLLFLSAFLVLLPQLSNAQTYNQGSMTTNQMNSNTSPNSPWTGSLQTLPITIQAYKSQIKLDAINSASIAKKAVGSNSTVVLSALTSLNGYLVYSVSIWDSSNNLHRVIVDAGNGKILSNIQINRTQASAAGESQNNSSSIESSMTNPNQFESLQSKAPQSSNTSSNMPNTNIPPVNITR